MSEPPEQRGPRLRELGLRIGDLEAGLTDSIADVAGPLGPGHRAQPAVRDSRGRDGGGCPERALGGTDVQGREGRLQRGLSHDEVLELLRQHGALR